MSDDIPSVHSLPETESQESGWWIFLFFNTNLDGSQKPVVMSTLADSIHSVDVVSELTTLEMVQPLPVPVTSSNVPVHHAVAKDLFQSSSVTPQGGKLYVPYQP